MRLKSKSGRSLANAKRNEWNRFIVDSLAAGYGRCLWPNRWVHLPHTFYAVIDFDFNFGLAFTHSLTRHNQRFLRNSNVASRTQSNRNFII